MTHVEQVEKFLKPTMLLHDSGIKSDINVQTKERLIKMLLEEVFELAAGLGTPAMLTYFNTVDDQFAEYKVEDNNGKYNAIEVLDALVDIEVVLHNATVLCGLTKYYDKAFDIVMQNNMKKVYLDKDTAEAIKAAGDSRTIVENGDGTYHVVNSYGKIMKPPVEDVKSSLLKLFY